MNLLSVLDFVYTYHPHLCVCVDADVLNVTELGSFARREQLCEQMQQGRIKLRLCVPTAMAWESLTRLTNRGDETNRVKLY